MIINVPRPVLAAFVAGVIFVIGILVGGAIFSNVGDGGETTITHVTASQVTVTELHQVLDQAKELRRLAQDTKIGSAFRSRDFWIAQGEITALNSIVVPLTEQIRYLEGKVP